MASRISRREWVRGLPSASGVGKYDRKRAHSASERSVGYGFLIRKSVRNHPNPHLYQTGSKKFAPSLGGWHHPCGGKGRDPLFSSSGSGRRTKDAEHRPVLQLWRVVG